MLSTHRELSRFRGSLFPTASFFSFPAVQAFEGDPARRSKTSTVPWSKGLLAVSATRIFISQFPVRHNFPLPRVILPRRYLRVLQLLRVLCHHHLPLFQLLLPALCLSPPFVRFSSFSSYTRCVSLFVSASFLLGAATLGNARDVYRAETGPAVVSDI